MAAPLRREADTREQILAAARQRYLRHGPRKTTMDEVAREAGCSRATLYAHFESKRALYSRLLEHETGAFVAALEAIADGEDATHHKLRAILETTVRTYAASPLLLGAVDGDDELAIEAIARPIVEAHEARVVALLQRLVEAGMAEGLFRPVDAPVVAELMYRLGQSLVTRGLADGSEPRLAHRLDVMDDLLAFGLAPRAGAEARPGAPT